MKDDLNIKDGITIPGHELEMTASRAGGPGGQHVNKASTRVTIRWNAQKTKALNEEQKERLLKNIENELTTEGDILVSSGASRSQAQNKNKALKVLARKIVKALRVPKKRMKTRTPKKVKEARLASKKNRGEIKKMRGKKYIE